MPVVVPGASTDLLDDSDVMQGLTSKMYRLAALSFSGMSDIEAYKAAGYGEGADPNRSEAAIGQAAHHAIRHPKVQAKLLELRLQADQQSSLAPYLNRELVINGILGLAMNADKDSTRLQAYIALGKTVGIDLFREVHVTEKITRTPEDVDRELLDHINRLKPVLEGSARDVTPPQEGAKPVPKGAGAGRDRRRKPSA